MARDSSGSKNEPQYDPNGIPADAADLTEVAAYAALVGNSKVLTDAQRVALAGADRWVGMTVYCTDTGVLWRYKATGWAVMMTEWADYNAAVTGLTVGNGVLRTKWRQIDKLVDVIVELTAGSSTVPTGPLVFQFPVPPVDTVMHRHFGEGLIRIGVGVFPIQPRMSGGATFSLATMAVTSGTAVRVGENVSQTFPTTGSWSGGSFYAHGRYEVA